MDKDKEIMMTDFEVYELIEKELKYLDSQSSNYSFLNKVYNHLKTTPSTNKTEPKIEKLLLSLKKFKLTPFELLQIINVDPSFYNNEIIKDTEKRFEESQINEMLNIINENFLD